MGLCDVITIVFVVLKLIGVISWSWLWVLSLIWIVIIILVVTDLLKTKNRKKYNKRSDKLKW